MSSKTFVDTSFVIALINKRDQYHQQARELADRFDGYPLLSVDFIGIACNCHLGKNGINWSVRAGCSHSQKSQLILLVRYASLKRTLHLKLLTSDF